jgi:hypothetical protein
MTMTCVYHPGQPSSSRCQTCQRPLCRACDHRIRGVSCCQDCIVEGVRLLQNRSLSAPAKPPVRRPRHPFLALLFSLFPGLGAVYNGQNVKALLIFTLIAGLEALANQLTGSLESLFTRSGIALYLYSIFDTYRSAVRAGQGSDLSKEDEELRNLLRRKTHLAGIILILAGSLVILGTLWPAALNRFWPILLIIAGFVGWRRGHLDIRDK